MVVLAAATITMLTMRLATRDPDRPAAQAAHASSAATDHSPHTAGVSPPPDAAARDASTGPWSSGGTAGPSHFRTVSPGTALPSASMCAAWVRARPYPETKGANRRANGTAGHRISGDLFSGSDAGAVRRMVPRIDGDFTGTTREILRWAACKWGIDEDLVFAQAAVESWWQQSAEGDWQSDTKACAPGHGLGADGRAGQCPQSWGIMQNRYRYQRSAWPGMATSTAMSADVAYGMWRACFEGYLTWLNTVARGSEYAAGDVWGCLGVWFNGRWHTSDGEAYIGKVRSYLDQRIWETRDFQQP